MIEFTIMLEGLAELKSRANRAYEHMRLDLREGVQDAARKGIEAAQADHPYQDHTFVLTGYQAGDEGTTGAVQVAAGADEEVSEMQWPAPYASYVDKGTSRSAPYPFTPIAEEAATKALQHNAQAAVDRFARSLER